MTDLLLFIIVISFVIIQRIVELFIAKGNEKWMKQQGAVEFGEKHYKYMVMIHVLFFVVLSTEKVLFERELSHVWPIVFSLFCFAQFMRIWAITSLGKYWNTKIIVLQGAKVVRKGPYRFLKHPNYFVVAIELITVPLLFSAYYTAFLFTVLNVIMLMVRIPEEEKALKSLTEYEGVFQDCNRFIPRIVK
ncbi:isoprenylcysteine carboxylmethyltransferase family protein [Neobacillus sp. WH10]|uniref:isoprenylcysteine carboxyl methyltransferase family protein n=1 Tax=Neobacillus sp. WH10 TaxID=3047873 RepID=UPI0024C18C83|nr:isoprenylcysteine carboxylmethyltransferase family protein [Neobacillus sp. WH10]WHY75820.1 isoprenylcysteine carboxylmethyltransferase family protein [Neobacillus sp. WH10]